MIKNRHYRALELDKVLQLLSREASCSESQERILSMEPSTGLYEVKLLLQETDDAHMLTGRFGSPSFGGLQNVANSLRRAQAGASLSMGELLKVAEGLRRKWLTARPRRWETSGGKSTPLHSGFGKSWII